MLARKKRICLRQRDSLISIKQIGGTFLRYQIFALLDDLDRRILRSVALHQSEQCSRIGGAEPDATVRHGAPEVADFSCAVDGVSSVKENRIRHRRVIVELGVMHPLQQIGLVVADRRAVAPSGRRHSPGRKIRTVDRDAHGLRRKLDTDGNARARAVDHRTGEQKAQCKEQRNTNIHNRAAAALPSKVCCPCSAASAAPLEVTLPFGSEAGARLSWSSSASCWSAITFRQSFRILCWVSGAMKQWPSRSNPQNFAVASSHTRLNTWLMMSRHATTWATFCKRV